jgi:FdhD protein
LNQIEEIHCIRISGHTRSKKNEVVAKESRLVLYVNENFVTNFLYSPGSERQLVFGYLISSGRIQKESDVRFIEFTDEVCRVEVLNDSIDYHLKGLEKDVSLQKLLEIRKTLLENQVNHKATRGFHGAILYDLTTERWNVSEDIGRHNAVDKVLGFGLLEGYNLEESVLLVSGRLVSNIVSKGVSAGLPIISSMTVATLDGIEHASKSNRTLVGSLSEGGCWLYFEGPMKVKTDIQ